MVFLFAVFLGTSAGFAYEGDTLGGFAYAVRDGQAIIRGHAGDASFLLIPRTVGEERYPVTAIEDLAFWGDDNLEEVRIRDGVVAIGEGAFMECENLLSVRLPSTLTHISTALFQGCLMLPEIDIPQGVASISGYAFNVCMSLRHVEIPSSVRSIGMYAFNRCDVLETVSLPPGIRYIEQCAFANCPMLKEIRIPASVQSLGDDVFWRHADDFKVLYEGSRDEWERLVEGRSGYKDLDVRFLMEGDVRPAPGSDLLVEDGYIFGVPIGRGSRHMEAGELLSRLESDEGVTLQACDPAGVPVSDSSPVTTGMQIRAFRSSELLTTLCVVVMGDVNETGLLSIAQLATMASWVRSPDLAPEGARFQAADWDGSGQIDIGDLVREANLIRN